MHGRQATNSDKRTCMKGNRMKAVVWSCFVLSVRSAANQGASPGWLSNVNSCVWCLDRVMIGSRLEFMTAQCRLILENIYSSLSFSTEALIHQRLLIKSCASWDSPLTKTATDNTILDERQHWNDTENISVAHV